MELGNQRKIWDREYKKRGSCGEDPALTLLMTKF